MIVSLSGGILLLSFSLSKQLSGLCICFREGDVFRSATLPASSSIARGLYDLALVAMDFLG